MSSPPSTPALRLELMASRWPRRIQVGLALLLLSLPWLIDPLTGWLALSGAWCGLWWEARRVRCAPAVLHLQAGASLEATAAATGLRQATPFAGTLLLCTRQQTLAIWPDVLSPAAHAALRAWLRAHGPGREVRMWLT